MTSGAPDASTPEGAVSPLAGLRCGVCLSSAFFGFYAHTGFLLALEDAGVRPAALTGSSAGAIVAALWASGRDAPEIRDRLLGIRRADFWDPAPPWDWLRGRPGILRGEAMQRLLERHLACRRFEECRAPLAVNAFDIGARRPVFLDRGELAPAVRASASLPGLFQPIRVGEAWYVDAGFVEKTPVGALLDREDLDLVLVHHLPSAASPPRPGRPGPVDLARAALEALRRRLDEALLEAAHRRGRRLRVIRPTRVPRVDPFHLDRGASALAAARSQAREALGRLAAEGAG